VVAGTQEPLEEQSVLLTVEPSFKPIEILKKKIAAEWCVYTFNPSTQEAKAGGSLSSRAAWSTE
jgi:hypothetical protein